MRISRFFTGGLVGVAVVVMLNGCASAPALSIYGELSDRCFETRSANDTFFAYVGITVTNPTGRDVILRDARPLELINATVTEITVAPNHTAEVSFGVAPGGELTPQQRPLWNDRDEINGAVIAAGGTAELIVELHALDYTHYAGLRGLRVKYDDGWFSATSTSSTSVGFVPAWSRCGTSKR